MEFRLRPLQGAGPIDFGMRKEEVRRILDGTPSEFMKTPDALVPTDNFSDLDLHVFYDRDFECVGIEFWPGADLVYQDHKIVGRPFSEVMPWVQAIDPDARLQDSIVLSHRLGLSLYAPDAEDEPDGRIESAYVFRNWP